MQRRPALIAVGAVLAVTGLADRSRDSSEGLGRPAICGRPGADLQEFGDAQQPGRAQQLPRRLVLVHAQVQRQRQRGHPDRRQHLRDLEAGRGLADDWDTRPPTCGRATPSRTVRSPAPKRSQPTTRPRNVVIDAKVVNCRTLNWPAAAMAWRWKNSYAERLDRPVRDRRLAAYTVQDSFIGSRASIPGVRAGEPGPPVSRLRDTRLPAYSRTGMRSSGASDHPANRCIINISR